MEFVYQRFCLDGIHLVRSTCIPYIMHEPSVLVIFLHFWLNLFKIQIWPFYHPTNENKRFDSQNKYKTFQIDLIYGFPKGTSWLATELLWHSYFGYVVCMYKCTQKTKLLTLRKSLNFQINGKIISSYEYMCFVWWTVNIRI